MFSLSKKRALIAFTVLSFSLFATGGLAWASPENAEGADSLNLSASEEGVFSLSGDEMSGKRGSAGEVNTLTSNQSLEATTSGNALNVGGNLTNGDISIGDHFGGFGSYVMNTGNNSTVNSAVSLNIQIMSSPAP